MYFFLKSRAFYKILPTQLSSIIRIVSSTLYGRDVSISFLYFSISSQLQCALAVDGLTDPRIVIKINRRTIQIGNTRMRRTSGRDA